MRKMRYTFRLKMAIRFAVKTHDVYQKQKRKGKDIAYITHPMTVALVLAQARANEDIVIAGVLHDTIEDSVEHKKVTVAMIRQRFGARVAAVVDSVTEHDKQAPWEERKREALSHIASFSHGSVLVKSADVISNVIEIVDDYARDGDRIFERFSRSKTETLRNYESVVRALVERWPKSPLAGDLRNLLKELRGIR